VSPRRAITHASRRPPRRVKRGPSTDTRRDGSRDRRGAETDSSTALAVGASPPDEWPSRRAISRLSPDRLPVEFRPAGHPDPARDPPRRVRGRGAGDAPVWRILPVCPERGADSTYDPIVVIDSEGSVDTCSGFAAFTHVTRLASVVFSTGTSDTVPTMPEGSASVDYTRTSVICHGQSRRTPRRG
jgi:hypothetical protein